MDPVCCPGVSSVFGLPLQTSHMHAQHHSSYDACNLPPFHNVPVCYVYPHTETHG